MGANWFIALSVPAGAWFLRIPEAPPQVRRFGAEDLHLTVAFLGAVSEEAARAAWQEAQAWPSGAIDVELTRVVPMGRPSRYSALSAELGKGHSEVERAIASVRDAMADAAAIPREHRA